MTKVSVLGSGAWGTALAMQDHYAQNEVTLWAYLEEEKIEIETFGENKSRLPGVKIAPEIKVTCDLQQAAQSDILLVVTPAQVIRPFLEELRPHLKPTVTLIFCSKGIEIETGALISEICDEVIPSTEIAILSGPNFAKEIAVGATSCASLAAHSLREATALADLLSSSTFRIYPNDDVMGTQMGGALKNVIAIASGMVDGAGLGQNARAAIITRGLAEMARYGKTKGAKAETFMGLSGMGDLILCCLSTTSRNMKFGYDLGQGMSTEELLKDGKPLAEGAHTVKAVHKLATEQGIDLPIFRAVYGVLYKGKTIKGEMESLLMCPQRSEG